MKILQLNNFEAIGGGSDRVYQLTTRMLLDRGHDVATLSCGEQSFDSRKTTILLPRNGYFNANPFRTLSNIRDFVYRPEAGAAIEDLVHLFKPDIAHLHIFYGQLSSSVIAALHHLHVPCVMTVHEYRLLCPISTLYTKRQGVCERCASGEKRHAIALRCNRDSLFASTLCKTLSTMAWWRLMSSNAPSALKKSPNFQRATTQSQACILMTTKCATLPPTLLLQRVVSWRLPMSTAATWRKASST